MKLPPFEYVRPQTLVEALDHLAAAEADAVPIAGGQSLVPMMAFRMAAPAVLVDISRLPELRGIAVGPGGTRLGAGVRWAEIEADARLCAAQPLLAAALPHIAHHQIRQKGTVGGSLALADPAAELPAVALCCGAEVEIAGPAGLRRVPVEVFLQGAMTTALEPGELVVALHLPVWPEGRRHAFEEFAPRRGDFAMAGVAVLVDPDGEGRVGDARLTALGVADTALRLHAAEAVLAGAALSDDRIARAAAAAEAGIDPPDDPTVDSEYRRALLGHLVETGLRRCQDGR